MDWMNAVGDSVKQCSGQGEAGSRGAGDPHQDFQRVTQAAHRIFVANGISEAERQNPSVVDKVSQF